MKEWPSITELLCTGGDSRIVPDARSGFSKYGCFATPRPELLAFASSTASTISPESFRAAESVYERLQQSGEGTPDDEIYTREMARIRGELGRLLDLGNSQIVFAASGTDLHLLAAQLIARQGDSPLLAILPEISETGSGVHLAIGGRHYSECTAFSTDTGRGMPIEGARMAEIVTLACRDGDGTPREAAAIDREVTLIAERAVAAGKHVLLTLIDVSKTGLIIPGPACARDLRERFGGKLDVLVDACQFRLAPFALRAYLKQGFLVAVTGSKFVEGPAFSGALLVPDAIAGRLKTSPLPIALAAYSAKGDWPEGWAARNSAAAQPNYGLLLRWEAALAHLRAFYALPEPAVAAFLKKFAEAVTAQLASGAFSPLPVTGLEHRGGASRDTLQTIFPFLLPGRSREDTQKIYEKLRADGFYLGQPVSCGARGGMPVSALRLCAGMKTIIDAVARGRDKDVIRDALSLLGKVEELAGN